MISETACTLESWIDEYIIALQNNSNITRKNVKTLIKANRVKSREAKKIAAQRLRDFMDTLKLLLMSLGLKGL
jgi:ribosomal protein L19E